MANNILLDKNIVLDLLLGRSGERENRINQLLSTFDEACITTNTFVTCFYVMRKSQISKEKIYQDLTKFEILEIDKMDCHLAYNLAQNIDDIEDCMELFTAKRNSCKMMSSDQKMIANYGEYFGIVEV